MLEIGESKIVIEEDGATFTFDNIDVFDILEFEKGREADIAGYYTNYLSKLVNIKDVVSKGKAVTVQQVTTREIKIPFGTLSRAIAKLQSTIFANATPKDKPSEEQAEKNE